MQLNGMHGPIIHLALWQIYFREKEWEMNTIKFSANTRCNVYISGTDYLMIE